MHRVFSMVNYSVTRASARKDSSTTAKVSDLQTRFKTLEANLAKALLINEALWEIIKSHHKLTDDDLNDKLYTIDMRDGQLDGKNQRSEPIKCPNCKRPVSSRHSACLYCGQIMDDSVFQMS